MEVKNETRLKLSEIEIRTIIANYIRDNYTLGVEITSYNFHLDKTGPYVKAVVTGDFDENIQIKEE